MLESIVDAMEEPGSSYRLVRNGLPVVAAGATGIILPSLLGCNRPSSAVVAVLALPLLATVGYNSLMYKKEFGSLAGFINGLDAFEAAVSRVFVYYEEISSYECELLRAAATRTLTICVRGMQAIVESLYDLGRSLESFTDLAKAYDHVYGPLEGREFFYELLTVENGPEQLLLDATKRRKVLLYLQSTCLYRWGLAIASGSDLGKARNALVKTMAVLQQSSKEIRAMFLPLPQENALTTTPTSKKVDSLKPRTLAVTTKLIATQQLLTVLIDTLEQVTNDPLRHGSKQLQLTADLLSIVRQSTESRLQDIIDLECDVARLISPQVSGPMCTTEPRTIEAEEDIDDEMTVAAGNPDTMSAEDEFFLHTASAVDSDSTAGVNADPGNEELPVEQVDKSTQRNYRTVLRQLHGKLQPIKQEFKVREQRALQRKGITAPFDQQEDQQEEEEEEEEEDSSDVDAMSISSLNSNDEDLVCKRTNYQQRYQDAVEQLAAKPQINLFPRIAPGFAPIGSAVEENIFE
uniref:Uncharacterized protein n=2 Tax=Anopheles albimanus TaxID=7167 RepID=A0A182FIE4_ANOAL